MRLLNLVIICLLFNSALFCQVITTPNTIVKGKKEGLWSELNICDTIDFEGNYHVVYGQHHNPQQVVAEGYYVNNKREGFWKEYWIVKLVEKTKSTYKRGNIKSIVEYKNDVPNNLAVEYYPNGNIKAVGHFENYPMDRFDTKQIPDFNDPEGNKMKDTVIHTTVGVRQRGKWYYFLPSGDLLKMH